MDWTQFDDIVDASMLEKLDKLDSGESSGEYEKIPYGKYEVVPEKIELTTSKSGNPMTVLWLRIVAGQYERSMIFAHFVMKSSFGIHKTKEFIRKLEPSSPVSFTSFSQWDIYLKGVAEEICGQSSYVLEYGETVNKKGDKFDNYEILDGPFEVPEDYTPPTPATAPVGHWVEE